MARAPGVRRSALFTALALLCLGMAAAAQAPAPGSRDPLTGVRSRLSRDWVGQRPEPADLPILVMAGHADSQGIAGAGTGGAAVDLHGARPMQRGMRDELYWNLAVARRVVDLGLQRGLNIRFYDPPQRTIHNGDDPRTNWSVGKAHAAAGGYALEIHFDAYGPDGVGSGVIPALHRPFSRIDESLARAFGGYPQQFRGGLGGRAGASRCWRSASWSPRWSPPCATPAPPQALAAIAERVVAALEQGLGRQPAGVASANGSVGLATGEQ